MKKALFIIAIVLFTMMAQAQTALKVHSNGTLSLQSSSTSGGVQFLPTGFASFEPAIIIANGRMEQTKPRTTSSKCWIVRNELNASPSDVFYVTGVGNVYCKNAYYFDNNLRGRGMEIINNASDLLRRMNGYYCDSDEFWGNPEDLVDNEYVSPEAIEGLLNDMGKTRSVIMNAEELEEVLPEAVRHDPEGKVGINYNAVVTVLVEAFKEQEAKIEQLESVLREHGLLR